jgi:hypothetical protein
MKTNKQTMKKIYSIFAFILISAAVTGQNTQEVFVIDYSKGNADDSTAYHRFNYGFTSPNNQIGELNFVGIAIDSVIGHVSGTTAIVSHTYPSKLLINKVTIAAKYNNTSGTVNQIKGMLVNLTNGNVTANNPTPLWDSTYALSGAGEINIVFEPNYETTSKIGFVLEYNGDIADILEIKSGYVHRVQALSGDNEALQSNIRNSFLSRQAGPFVQKSSDVTTPSPAGGNFYHTAQNWKIQFEVVRDPVQDPDPSSVNEKVAEAAKVINYPNPAKSSTTFKYDLGASANVKISVSDITGRVIANINEGYKGPGTHTVQYNTSELNEGLYFYTLEAGSSVITKKMIVVK